jgi:hypothetical protein
MRIELEPKLARALIESPAASELIADTQHKKLIVRPQEF